MILLQDALDQGLYQPLVDQLQKDFDRANIPADFSVGSDAEALLSALHEKVYVLIMERFTDFINLLYVVDVPEKAFKTIPPTDAVEVAGEASFLVLDRERQKVWMKRNHRQ